MALPRAVETLWNELQAAREELLKEVEGLSQAQADWRPGDGEWSIGEILHHVTLGEIATGKLTTKLVREAEVAGKLAPYPPDLTGFAPIPRPQPGRPTGAPPHILPETGQPIGQLLAELRSTRARTRQSIERLGSVDPRPLTWEHVTFGVLDLGQWWKLILTHDRMHLEQIRAAKAAPGFARM